MLPPTQTQEVSPKKGGSLKDFKGYLLVVVVLEYLAILIRAGGTHYCYIDSCKDVSFLSGLGQALGFLFLANLVTLFIPTFLLTSIITYVSRKLHRP